MVQILGKAQKDVDKSDVIPLQLHAKHLPHSHSHKSVKKTLRIVCYNATLLSINRLVELVVGGLNGVGSSALYRKY